MKWNNTARYNYTVWSTGNYRTKYCHLRSAIKSTKSTAFTTKTTTITTTVPTEETLAITGVLFREKMAKNFLLTIQKQQTRLEEKLGKEKLHYFPDVLGNQQHKNSKPSCPLVNLMVSFMLTISRASQSSSSLRRPSGSRLYLQ